MLHVSHVSISRFTPSIDGKELNNQYDLQVAELTMPVFVKKVTAIGIRRNYDNLAEIDNYASNMGSFAVIDSDLNIIGEFIDFSNCENVGINELLKPVDVALNGGDTIRIVPQNSREAVQVAYDIVFAEHQSLDPEDKKEILIDVYIQYE